MSQSKQQIVSDFRSYINGSSYNKWYVGVTSNIQKRLFGDHNVEKNGFWIYSPTASDRVARDVEKHFLSLGMDGGKGGGDASANFVYAYLMNSTTNP